MSSSIEDIEGELKNRFFPISWAYRINELMQSEELDLLDAISRCVEEHHDDCDYDDDWDPT